MKRARYSQQNKQYYLDLCHKLRVLRDSGLGTRDERTAFVRLSVAVHAAKANVPKSWYAMADK